MWLNQSATPLERPKEFAGRPLLTDEEVAEFKRRAARIFHVNTDSDFPGGDNFFQALMANPDRYASPTATGSATVMIERTIEHRTSLIMDPPDGKIPAMTPDGQARFERTPPPTAAGMKRPPAGPQDLSNALRCITYGTPRVGLQNINAAGPMGYYQILQTPDYVTLTLEAIHETRIIPLDGRPHLPQGVRLWSGDSRGRWEGNTLVVDTTNFSQKSNFMGAAESLHIVERFTRVAEDTLQYEVTVDDATTWTRPWTVMIRMNRTQDKIYEYACHEGNYHTMEGILGAARADEAAGKVESSIQVQNSRVPQVSCRQSRSRNLVRMNISCLRAPTPPVALSVEPRFNRRSVPSYSLPCYGCVTTPNSSCHACIV